MASPPPPDDDLEVVVAPAADPDGAADVSSVGSDRGSSAPSLSDAELDSDSETDAADAADAGPRAESPRVGAIRGSKPRQRSSSIREAQELIQNVRRGSVDVSAVPVRTGKRSSVISAAGSERPKSGIVGISGDVISFRDILTRQPHERTEYEVAALASHVGTLSVFSSLDSESCRELCRMANYCEFQPYDVIFRQGEAGSTYYIVLSGQVDIWLLRTNKKTGDRRHVCIDRLGPGVGFGELSLIRGEPRSATVTAHEHTELMAVQKRYYDGILRLPEFRAYQEKMRFLQKLSHFRHWTAPKLSRLTYGLREVRFDANRRIFGRGDPPSRVFIISCGQVRIVADAPPVSPEKRDWIGRRFYPKATEIAMIGEREILGLEEFVDRKRRRRFTAVADTAVTAYCMSGADFLARLEPTTRARLESAIAARIDWWSSREETLVGFQDRQVDELVVRTDTEAPRSAALDPAVYTDAEAAAAPPQAPRSPRDGGRPRPPPIVVPDAAEPDTSVRPHTAPAAVSTLAATASPGPSPSPRKARQLKMSTYHSVLDDGSPGSESSQVPRPRSAFSKWEARSVNLASRFAHRPARPPTVGSPSTPREDEFMLSPHLGISRASTKPNFNSPRRRPAKRVTPRNQTEEDAHSPQTSPGRSRHRPDNSTENLFEIFNNQAVMGDIGRNVFRRTALLARTVSIARESSSGSLSVVSGGQSYGSLSGLSPGKSSGGLPLISPGAWSSSGSLAPLE